MYEEKKGHPGGGEEFPDGLAESGSGKGGPRHQEPPESQESPGSQEPHKSDESPGPVRPEEQGLSEKPRAGHDPSSGGFLRPDPFDHLFDDPRDVRAARREARQRARGFISRLRRRRPTASQERKETLRRIKREGRITAVDLRRRTSEIIAALDRNEELLISHRNRWVGVITPISLIQDASDPPPIMSSRYFGFARWAPRLRRNRDWPGYATRVEEADGANLSVGDADQGDDADGQRPGDRSGDRPGDEPMAPCPV